MKYKIKSIDVKTKKEKSVQFESLEIHQNLPQYVYLLHNNQKKTRMVYSFTKSRSDFTSGGAKPYRQKGTGRARMGTNRSPLKVGGSVIFGPKPRFVYRKSNRQFTSNNIKQLLLSKIDSSFVVNGFDKIEKVKEFSPLLDSNKIYLLLLDINKNEDVHLFTRIKNLPNVYINAKNSINFEDLLRVDHVVYTQESFDSYFGNNDKEQKND